MNNKIRLIIAEDHPFTKQKLELGVILSKKIITIPFFYSLLSMWTGFDAVNTVWVLGTMLTIVCSLCAFAELGGLLFFRDFKKTWLLLVFMELMYLSGDYYVGSVGYRQLFYGYSGEGLPRARSPLGERIYRRGDAKDDIP